MVDEHVECSKWYDAWEEEQAKVKELKTQVKRLTKERDNLAADLDASNEDCVIHMERAQRHRAKNEHLQAEMKRLRAALREIGHDWCREHCDGDDHTDTCNRARAALERKEGE